MDAVILKHTYAIAPDPAEILDYEHKHDEMREAIAQLPSEYQVVLRLYYWDDMPQQNIADFLAVPLTTVKWRLYKAKQMLKEHLENHQKGEK